MTNKISSAPPGDRRVRRTQATLQRALIGLVGERDLSQVSVADVADRADVSRSTFYDHYADVHELAEAACTTMLDDLFRSVLALDTAPADPSSQDPDPALTGFFTHFAEHAGLYRSLLGPTGSARVIEHVRRRTTAAAHYSGRLAPSGDTPPPDTAGSPGFPLDVPAAFVAGALIGVAADWLQRGCPRTPLEMTILTKPLLVALRPGTGMPPRRDPGSEREIGRIPLTSG
jgi:AcrR family transcriptional regulator